MRNEVMRRKREWMKEMVKEVNGMVENFEGGVMK